MSEIVEDIKSQAIEIINDLGLNFSSNNPRIKHTGDGSLTIETTSSQETALEISVQNGGIDMVAGKKIMIDTSDTTDGIKIGTGFSVPITIGTSTTENTVPGNVTIHGNLTVEGDTLTNNVVIYTQEDPVFYINSGFTGTNTYDIGFIGERGTLENVGWIWNEANKEWAAIGTTDNGFDPVVDPISNYKPIKAGGLRVVTDTGNATPTVFNVAVNGAVDINTSDATNGIDIGTSPAGIPVTIGSASSTVVIAGITFSSGGGGGGLNTDQVLEGITNLYFLPSRAVAAVEDDANLVLNGAIAASFTHNSASDFTLSHNGGNGRLILTGTKAGSDAIQMNATTVGGGIDINSGSGGVTIDTSGALSLDSNVASNLTVTGSGQNLIISSAGGGLQQTLVSSEGTVSNAIQLTAFYGGIAMNSVKSSLFNVNGSGESLTLTSTGGGAQQTVLSSAGTGVDAIQLNASSVTGGIDINAGSGGITVDTTGGLSLDAGTASNLTTSTGDLTLSATTNSVVITGAEAAVDAIQLNATTVGGGIDINAGSGGITIDTTGGLSLDAGAASNFTTSVGAITVNGKLGVDLQYDSVSQANFSADGTLTLKANNPYTVTHAANGAADDLTISQTGSFDASLLLTSAGTGSDAIGLSATGTGGGITISANDTLALTASTVNIARNAANPVNIGFTNSETNVYGNLTVSGNLLINGTTVTNNATVNTYVDPIFYLNSGMTGTNTRDIGFVGERGTAGNNVAFIWDEQLDEWAAIETSLTGLGNVLEDPIIKYAPLKVGSFSVQGGVGTSVNIDVTGAISLDTTDTTNGITIGTVNANVPITIGTTGSTVSISGGVINGTQTITSATSLAISLSTLITFFDGSLGAITATLANGTVGQTKILIMTNNTNQASVTPTTKLGFTTITFNGNGDSATLIYTSSGWVIVNERNTTIS